MAIEGRPSSSLVAEHASLVVFCIRCEDVLLSYRSKGASKIRKPPASYRQCKGPEVMSDKEINFACAILSK